MTFRNAMKMSIIGFQATMRRCVAFAVAICFASALFAAEVTSTDAACAAKAWVDRGYAMGVFASERTVAGVDEIEDATTGARLHVVKFVGGGFVVLSTDDLIDPVIAFSATGDGLATTDDNPLWALLRGDIAARETAAGVVRGTGSAGGKRLASSRVRAASATATASQQKWSALLGGGMRLMSASPGNGIAFVSDMRVAPMLQTQWGQENDADGGLCYNAYTPNNYACGCVATAGAQVMRYFQWPSSSAIIPPFTNSYCRIDGTNATLITQGGSYDWDLMPFRPDSYTSSAARQAIGKLTYDIGVCLGTEYATPTSSASFYMLAETLTNHFGYASALLFQRDQAQNTSLSDPFRRALLSNLDAECPVLLSLRENSGYGHAAVADGYGYSGEGENKTFYLHMNFGWKGIGDMWYSLPEIDSGDGFIYRIIDGFIFNVLTNMPSSTVICSGRVLDAFGNPVVGAVVSCSENGAASSGPVESVRSNAKGIYALMLQPGQYKVRATWGDDSSAVRDITLSPNVATMTRLPNWYDSESEPMVGNLCGQDLVLQGVETVAAPQFDPPSCGFCPVTNVSISCDTPGATIRYTLDGTEPTGTSAVYMGPVTITDDTVIRAKAWGKDMNPSDTAVATYTYDASQGIQKGDNFAYPSIISGIDGSYVVDDNQAYTVESGEKEHTYEDELGAYDQYKTIWYEWTAPGSGEMTFTAKFTCGERLSWPMIAVYTGDSHSSIQRVCYDADDEDVYDEESGDWLWGAGDGKAVATFSVTQGVTYRIVGMTGHPVDYGTFTLSWSGSLTVAPTETSTPEPVPYSWLDEYLPSSSSVAGGYNALAMRDDDGDGLRNWEEYVLGTNPTNAESRLSVSIRMEGGVPQVDYAPKPELEWFRGGYRPVLMGSDSLTEGWTPITDAASSGCHFFKVVVEPPLP